MGSSPRVWGQAYSDFCYTAGLGSSPRVWGQEVVIWICVQLIRIIPTRMGTSWSKMPKSIDLRDHPHAYGDKIKLILLQIKAIGSSPRVWGQDYVNVCNCRYCGIIPTRMGTRSEVPQPRLARQDHPHAYGDKRFLPVPPPTPPGSSPRVWGQDQQALRDLLNSGIIPTRMGTSDFKIAGR